jgi:hypothetical protein
MRIQQISVFIENQSGRLSEVATLLGESSINIRALSLADTADFGILRLIVDKPEEAYKILKANDFTVGRTDVIAVEVPDKPGGLASVLNALSNSEVNVEYMYAFVHKGNTAAMIFRFDDTEMAVNVIEKAGLNVIRNATIYAE